MPNEKTKEEKKKDKPKEPSVECDILTKILEATAAGEIVSPDEVNTALLILNHPHWMNRPELEAIHAIFTAIPEDYFQPVLPWQLLQKWLNELFALWNIKSKPKS
ncbi:MAG: hypothetical protein A2445_04865 [Candidatus Jacksonbacteria bacterium RIFOXYC2_FULL_44_29]|nr:MAG: hypothetical protein UW45_C0002G0021 [Parcubacteria group bacterium GW2011_GWC2_44_22]OGY75192.1 MAG: hypothetical protein A2240_01150 [Candidatus Jacksonbacteria bacterium RIFOXYA2_FULL_43_12]OGY75654.1 MAG: hypothetical protein A2295_04745 [Candidatus Jacksonbacteria bacterium RIFOXYB2_FULL_44_15]OGY77798.1 MAG: hypothetical protein A2445_04865 [Candidatus Jacksonbacteria bacterium RIFOXYC2_FULL_44_29]OGY79528.1 MAG: hypothetical protein A2550_02155 [Candidatus Jacksonbacteria bacteri